MLLEVGNSVEERADVGMSGVEFLRSLDLDPCLLKIAFLDESVGDQKTLLGGFFVLLYKGRVLSLIFLTGGQRDRVFLVI